MKRSMPRNPLRGPRPSAFLPAQLALATLLALVAPYTLSTAAHAQGEIDEAKPLSLDELTEARPRDPDNEDLLWEPGPCLDAIEIEPPAAPGTTGWEAALAEQVAVVDALRERVDAVTEMYASTLDRARIQPTERVELGDERAAARDAYSEARCRFFAMKEAARDAGVLPGVLRRYRLDETAD